MRDLIEKLAQATVHLEPYPHIVIENALAPERCAALLREMPPLEVLTMGEPPRSNHRFSLPAWNALEDPRVSDVWKNLMREGLSQEFLQAILQKLALHIRCEHPDFETVFGPINALEARQRQQANRPINTVGMDVQIAVNTPALTAGTTVRGGHLDKPDKVFTGLLYLRHEEDESTGAELELYEVLGDDVVFGYSCSLPGSKLRTIRSVPYRNNTLVIFLNTPRSVHGVTPRGVAPWPRYHINIVGEMQRHIFELKLDESIEPPPSSASMAPATPKMPPLLGRCKKQQVQSDPFPMLVLENALEGDLYRELDRTLPACLRDSHEVLFFGPAPDKNHYCVAQHRRLSEEMPDNSKVVRHASSLLADPDLPQIWRDFIEANLSQEAWEAYVRLFGEYLLREFPDLEQRFGSLSSMRARHRGIDPVTPGDVQLDVLVGCQTAVKGEPCIQRGPHLKKTDKILEVYLYFRPEEDVSGDGAHQFFAITNGSSTAVGEGWQADPSKVEVVRSMPSAGNTLLAWVNTPRSFQNVAPRGPTPHTLPFVELLVQLPDVVFPVEWMPARIGNLPAGEPLPSGGALNGLRQRLKRFFGL